MVDRARGQLPVVQAIVDRHAGKRILEIGNVLSHYRPQRHVIVDKYEHAPGVLNRDVLDLDDLGRFDLIVAVSTIEHVGWDEEPREPGKAVEALCRLQALLSPGGELVVTVPIGYHPPLDEALRTGSIDLTRAGALRRVDATPGGRCLSTRSGRLLMTSCSIARGACSSPLWRARRPDGQSSVRERPVTVGLGSRPSRSSRNPAQRRLAEAPSCAAAWLG